jgi:secondary thiamine-phosphate synthase enzyme
MKLEHHDVSVRTRGQGFTDVTREVAACVAKSGVVEGLCTVFIQHTSASLLIQENADPTVQSDLLAWLSRVAPEDAQAYQHDAEGPDDMPSHLRSAITRTSETIPVRGGRLALGTWQALYVVEHRTSPHTRRLVVTVLGA